MNIKNNVSVGGLLITLGIVFGDIGTSPLYVVKAIKHVLGTSNQETIFGGISLIFWTLTLQTTIKYVTVTLRANNKGEGGIFALFALLRKRYSWAYILALIGGSTLLADGIITPAITVTSAIEGLRFLNPDIPVIPIIVAILSGIFFMQQFGTRFLGNAFGPIMLVWFVVIAFWGSLQIIKYPEILAAVNPMYSINLLANYPGSFLILGAVFLATTGAEALYSDLGHCGIRNIRITWIFVKITLLLNYFGQGAWFIHNPDFNAEVANPFFAIMPQWFILPGTIIATLAAIIASQALISGSFTLISEAISLNLWPKMTIKYPTEMKGQMYVPFINQFLWAACIFVVILFQKSTAMEAAYGLAITITMLMTTSLLLLYLRRRVHVFFVILMGVVYIPLESIFIYGNLNKFTHGGWFTILAASVLAILMYSWYNGRKIKNSLMKFMPVEKFLKILKNIRNDNAIPKFATNLVYLTKADKKYEIESTIHYSILDKLPKRADMYWFIHIDIKDEPYICEYEVTGLIPGVATRIDFRLGFRIEPQVNLLFRQVLEDLAKSGEYSQESGYPSLKKFNIKGDCRYVIIDRILTQEHEFNLKERLIMLISNLFAFFAIPDPKSYHLDASNIVVEKVPLGEPDKLNQRIRRINELN